MKPALAIAAVAAILTATPALADPRLPDGTYQCMMEQYGAGGIEIVGDTYKGPAFDGKYTGTYDFEIDSHDNIHWGGPVGGYTDPGYTLIASRIVSDSHGNVGIEMSVKMDGSEHIHFVQCFTD
jgi:hypothetical protein